MKTTPEKRSRCRENIHQQISFEICEVTQGRLQNSTKIGLATDISSGGIGIATDYLLQKGDVLKVRFPVSAMKVSLPVFAEVMWLKAAAGDCRVGLRFLD